MIQFSLRQLEYFVAAAQQGGTLQAARFLHVSQPSISNAISALETLWQTRLFVRLHAQGMQLTADGVKRYRRARRILQQAQALSQKSELDIAGELKIGCFSTLGPRYFPGLVRACQKAYPQIKVRLFEADTETLLDRIERDTLDLALMYDTGIAGRVTLHLLDEHVPYVLLPLDHYLAGQESVHVSELDQEPFILINLPHSREYFLSILDFDGVKPNIVAETSSLEMVRSMVANGHGVSILVTRPNSDITYDGKAIVCKPLLGRFPTQKMVLAATREHALTPAGAAFLDIARRHLQHPESEVVQQDFPSSPAPPT
ncbi:LysR family transcriptional regulator [Paenalcaligenes niemegkensis]|uniref:LysR family transcriptional regulator n=1 Tax=Paenalcaligenes niemegkensis TaxID=2895469 RepID=UPI001EE9948C|nr:LysR family transcriptional regulator [Paenalcaligenes niemegkensis]MCQ9617085.1 LysR family transcriptional regulator [Paenalcaligenes niemegkensis]